MSLNLLKSYIIILKSIAKHTNTHKSQIIRGVSVSQIDCIYCHIVTIPPTYLFIFISFYLILFTKLLCLTGSVIIQFVNKSALYEPF